jgi:hypothetical protein
VWIVGMDLPIVSPSAVPVANILVAAAYQAMKIRDSRLPITNFESRISNLGDLGTYYLSLRDQLIAEGRIPAVQTELYPPSLMEIGDEERTAEILDWISARLRPIAEGTRSPFASD